MSNIEITLHIRWRVLVSRIIYLVSFTVSLVVLWQVVRFWEGNIGAPMLDQIFQLFSSAFEPDTTNPRSEWLHDLGTLLSLGCYYTAGSVIWVGLSGLAWLIGQTCGRIVAVGFHDRTVAMPDSEAY